MRRSSLYAREIALILIIKVVLLTCMMHSLARPPALGSVEKQNRAAQHLLGVQPPPSENTYEREPQ